MNIDRYAAMLRHDLAEEHRARIEQLLDESHSRLAEAIRQLSRAIAPNDPGNAPVPVSP
jgi:hypothetical protein